MTAKQSQLSSLNCQIKSTKAHGLCDMSIDFMQNLAIIHITFWFTFCRFVFLSLSSSATLLLFHAGLKMYCFYKSFPSVDCQTAFFDGLIGLEFLCSLLYFLKLVQLIFRVSTSLGNSGLCWTVFAQNRDTAVPAEGNGDLQTLICVLWLDPDDVLHCRILSTDKTEWQIISATLCGWKRCFVADQLWFTTRIREEEEEGKLLVIAINSNNHFNSQLTLLEVKKF